MNNLTFGDETFGYYETICGGHGAGPTWDGQSCVTCSKLFFQFRNFSSYHGGGPYRLYV